MNSHSLHVPAPESGQVPIRLLPIDSVRPSPENERLHRPVDPSDPAIVELAQAIGRDGILEALVVTADGYIVSGHRRHAGAKLGGLAAVPCRVLPVRRGEDPDRFMRLLREFNRQREKTSLERLREAVLDADPEAAYQSLIEHRSRMAGPGLAAMAIDGVTTRAKLSPAKALLLAAATTIVRANQAHWPLSVRQVHYRLLNDPRLKHASKPDSAYRNDLNSYKDLCDLLTRARIARLIPWEAVADETRPVSVWQVYPTPGAFVSKEVDGLFKGYWRDLMQGQADHVEIVCEKNTVQGILRSVAMRYTIPLTTGRGYCSSPPRQAMAQRYLHSGKRRLVLLLLSDFDPDGEEIAHSFARSMRDDFGVSELHPVKVALTSEQVRAYRLPPIMKAKASSAHHDKFVGRHGDDVFELEALAPGQLQAALTEAIDRVIDVAAFNAELEAERRDAAFLDGVRRTVARTLAEMDLREGAIDV